MWSGGTGANCGDDPIQGMGMCVWGVGLGFHVVGYRRIDMGTILFRNPDIVKRMEVLEEGRSSVSRVALALMRQAPSAFFRVKWRSPVSPSDEEAPYGERPLLSLRSPSASSHRPVCFFSGFWLFDSLTVGAYMSAADWCLHDSGLHQ